MFERERRSRSRFYEHVFHDMAAPGETMRERFDYFAKADEPLDLTDKTETGKRGEAE